MYHLAHWQVMDARPAGRFLGEAPEPRPNLPSGHIPGSINVPFTDVLEDGRYAAAHVGGVWQNQNWKIVMM